MNDQPSNSAEIENLTALVDPVDRVIRATEIIAHHQRIASEISRLRLEALDQLASQGHSQVELARMLGMTRTRVQQLLTTGSKARRPRHRQRPS